MHADGKSTLASVSKWNSGKASSLDVSECSCRGFFNVQLIMQYLNSFLSCSIRNLTLASLSHLFTIKIDVFALFTSFNSHSGLFP